MRRGRRLGHADFSGPGGSRFVARTEMGEEIGLCWRGERGGEVLDDGLLSKKHNDVFLQKKNARTHDETHDLYL